MDITLSHLSKTYRDADRALRVIDDLSYIFPSGKTLAIVGTSGIGKSTLLQLVGGLDRPSSGSVVFGSTDLSKLNDQELSRFRGKHIGFVFQFHQLLPEFTAVENVSMPLIIAGLTDAEADAQSEKMLQRVGLAERLSHRPGALSGGEQQRVAIARALVAQPKVVLADEPTGNLDVGTAREVSVLLREVNRELGTTLIVVTHNPELAAQMDIVLEMSNGGNLGSWKK